MSGSDDGLVEVVLPADEDMSAFVNRLCVAIGSCDAKKVAASLRALQSVPLDADLGNSLLKSVELAASITTWLAHPGAGLKNDPVCSWFYGCYESDVPALQSFVLSFLPPLLWLYVSRHSSTSPLSSIETVLLGIYNIELVTRGDAPTLFTPPSSSVASVYHQPVLSESLAKLTASALHRVNREPTGAVVRDARLPLVQQVSAADRPLLVVVALSRMEAMIGSVSSVARLSLCQFCARFARHCVRGLDRMEFDVSRVLPSAEFLLQKHCTREPEAFLLSEGRGDSDSDVRPSSVSFLIPSVRPLVAMLQFCVSTKFCRGAALEACRHLHARVVYEALPSAILATSSLLQVGPSL